MGALNCQGCDGHGTVLLMNSWYTADGFREQRCPICRGSRRNPTGFTAWGDQLAAQRRFRALRAEMIPATRAALQKEEAGRG